MFHDHNFTDRSCDAQLETQTLNQNKDSLHTTLGTNRNKQQTSVDMNIDGPRTKETQGLNTQDYMRKRDTGGQETKETYQAVMKGAWNKDTWDNESTWNTGSKHRRSWPTKEATVRNRNPRQGKTKRTHESGL